MLVGLVSRACLKRWFTQITKHTFLLTSIQHADSFYFVHISASKLLSCCFFPEPLSLISLNTLSAIFTISSTEVVPMETVVSQRGLWTIQSYVDLVSGKTHCF